MLASVVAMSAGPSAARLAPAGFARRALGGVALGRAACISSLARSSAR